MNHRSKYYNLKKSLFLVLKESSSKARSYCNNRGTVSKREGRGRGKRRRRKEREKKNTGREV